MHAWKLLMLAERLSKHRKRLPSHLGILPLRGKKKEKKHSVVWNYFLVLQINVLPFSE